MPWPSQTACLGKPHPRAEAPAKVRGAARFTADAAPDGRLFGAVFRSPWPAAKVSSIDLSAARSAPGIRAAVLVRDGPRQVRYYGEELAAVAGTSRQAVEDAIALIRVDASPLPFVVREIDAIATHSPRVFPESANLGFSPARENGNHAEAFAKSAAIVEGVFSTPVQLHNCLEPHGNTIDWSGESIRAWSSTQGIFSVRDGLAERFAMPQNQITVTCEHMGGGFGSKVGLGVEGALCAQLSKEAGAPVQLMLTRFEEALSVGNRPSSIQKIRLGADSNGRLTAFSIDAFGSPGYAAGAATAAGGGGGDIPAPYLYRVGATHVRQGNVAINTGSARAMRAPAHPPASFGMESIMDELAVRLGLDPVELRLLNDPSEIRQREYRLAVERFGWKQKYKKPGSSPGPLKTGVGCAGAMWGGGGRRAQAEVQINPDGSAEVRCGTQDLGTGSRTVVQLVAAEILRLDPGKIAVRIGDTHLPANGSSGGSTTTANIGPAVLDACENAVAALAKLSGIPEPRGDRWLDACRAMGLSPLSASGQWKSGYSSSNVGGVQFAEVEVDTETGFVRVLRILCVQDCGLVVNPLTATNQVNGGIIMGLGYALYEQRIADRTSGVILNANFETYKLPGPADMPEIDVVLLDMPERGIIGLGEPVTIPTASAIGNAVANAIGARVTDLPITPDKVLAALGLVPGARQSWAQAMASL